jgi:hypothetical protein
MTSCWRSYMYLGMFDFLKTHHIFLQEIRGRPCSISFPCLILRILTSFHLLSPILTLFFSVRIDRRSFKLYLIPWMLLLINKISFRLHLFLVMLLCDRISFRLTNKISFRLPLISAISNLTIPVYKNCHVLLMFSHLLEEFLFEHVNRYFECKIMSPTMWSILFLGSCFIIDSRQHIMHFLLLYQMFMNWRHSKKLNHKKYGNRPWMKNWKLLLKITHGV